MGTVTVKTQHITMSSAEFPDNIHRLTMHQI